ncbi:MAG: acetyl-CoA carboxylase carboxyltransferase subunit alpha [Polyangiaceae bacterium]|nr:acetyl-CoA carboxylase carboxyltransferase subunit alpha [Polyangiaceae bacterium]
MAHVLPFERPVVDLLTKVRELRSLAAEDDRHRAELKRLEKKATTFARELFAQLDPIQKVQLSRHPARPYTLDYIDYLFDDFVELHGDRRFRDDPAIVAGIASFHGTPVMVMGHQKGRDTKQNLIRNFGMPNPEGYRKALRLYEIADRFGLPVMTFVDTKGAYPGLEAEERGQSEAIGACIEAMAGLRVPILTTVIGEGGSGGALALGVANRVMIQEFSYYSVISPEGCASILWKTPEKAAEAAERLKLTAPHLLELGVVDGIIDEPPGGAHQDFELAAKFIDQSLKRNLRELLKLSGDELVEDRYDRFRRLGSFIA